MGRNIKKYKNIQFDTKSNPLEITFMSKNYNDRSLSFVGVAPNNSN